MKSAKITNMSSATGPVGITADTAQPSTQLEPNDIPYSHLIHNPGKRLSQVLGVCREAFNAVRFLEGLTPCIKAIVR